MSFGGGGGGSGSISTSSDVALSNPATGQFLEYNTATAKWNNAPAALTTGGGAETVATNSTATGATTLNLANGNVFNVTMTGDVTFTFSGATNGKACSFGLYLSQDATGSHAVTWPSGVKWAGGTAPTLTTTASAVDVLVFESLDGGTTWYGSLVGANFQ